MRIGALFYGTGALDLAVTATWDAELAWYAENDTNVARIGQWNNPGVVNLGDVRGIDWGGVEGVDVLTGGSPCHDLSLAGQRAGMFDGTRSNLWTMMRAAIAALQPRLVVWENVRGAYSVSAQTSLEHCPGCVGSRRATTLRALGRVLGDLADLGYDARWYGLPASEVGAPHGRYRIFVLAYPQGTAPPDPAEPGQDGGRLGQAGRRHAHFRVRPGQLLPTPTVMDRGDKMNPAQWDEFCIREDEKWGNGNGHGNSLSVEAKRARERGNWGRYMPAVYRWEQLTRPHPEPLKMNERIGEEQVTPAFVEWMMGFPRGWVTGVPGLERKPAHRALGNAVVPQQGERAFRVMCSWGP